MFLHIQTNDGKNYVVNEKGEITHYHHFEAQTPSGQWLFQGVSTHHWHNHIVHSFAAIWENPKLALKGYVWDLDHGTTRTWANRRITFCHKSDKATG